MAEIADVDVMTTALSRPPTVGHGLSGWPDDAGSEICHAVHALILVATV
ncbi:MAG: hypothetical protein ACYTG0_22855 [Planctomycetota bacterium]